MKRFLLAAALILAGCHAHKSPFVRDTVPVIVLSKYKEDSTYIMTVQAIEGKDTLAVQIDSCFYGDLTIGDSLEYTKPQPK